MATPLQKKVDAIQAKVDAQNAAKTPVVPPTPEVPLSTNTPVPAPQVQPAPLSPVEAIRAARAKVVAPAPWVVAPVNTAPNTPWQDVAKAKLEANGIDTTKLGTWVWENFVPYKGEQATVIPDTTWKVNADGTPIVPTPTEPKAETKTTTKPLETTTPSPIVVQNEDEAFKTLMAGGILADTRENNAFKQTYKQFWFYNWLDNKTLANKISAGEVGSKFTNLLARFNPTKYAEVVKMSEDITKVNDINANAQRLYNVANKTPQPAVTKTSDQLMQDLISGIETVPQKYSDIVAQAYADNPEIKEKSDKLAVLDDKVDTIDTEIDKMYETYRTQYPDVPQAMLMGMVNRATYGLTQERNALVKESKLLYSQYKDEKDQIDQGIQYDIAQQDKIDQRMFDLKTTLYGNKRADEIRDEDYARAEERIMNDRTYTEEQRKIALEDNLKIALSDIGEKFNPNADYNTLLGQYADAKKKQIESGQYLDRYQAETQRLNALKTSTKTNKETPSYLGNYSDISEVSWLYDWPMANIINAKPWDVIPTTRQEYRKLTPTGGMQCAEYVNRIMGSSFWNSLDDKLKIAQDNNGTVGSAVVMDVGTPEWHIGIITKDLWDSWEVKSSNYNLDGRISVDKIPKWNIAWYYTPDSIKSKPMDSSQRVFRSQELTRFKDSQKDFLTALDQQRNLAVSLIEDPNGVTDLGSVYQFMKTLDPDSVVRETEFATAAKASGFADRNTINQYLDALEKWVILTGKQRENMLKISKKYVEKRAERYDADYDKLIDSLKSQWITNKDLYPVRASDFIRTSSDTPELSEKEIQIIKDVKAKYPNATDEDLDDALNFYKSLQNG